MLDKVQQIVQVNEQIREKTIRLREENARRSVLIKKWKDRIAMENLMGRFAILYSAGCYHRLTEFFADTDQIYLQRSDVGIYEGKQAIEEYFAYLESSAVPGSFRMMNLTSPVIEVSKEGGTAQGMWFINGLEAIKDVNAPEKPAADLWVNDKLAVEFLETTEGWKILRMTICEEMRGLYHKSWGEYSIEPEYPSYDTFPAPTRPADRHLPFRADRKSQKNLTTPEPFASYESLAEHF